MIGIINNLLFGAKGPLTPALVLDSEMRAQVAALFDTDYYLQKNADVVAAKVDPLDHYLENGWKEGRDPSPMFSTRWYLEQNLDIDQAGINPFLHWVLHGRAEGYLGRPSAPKPLGKGSLSDNASAKVKQAFGMAFYLEHNPDVVESEVDPFGHFMDYGWREGRDPSPFFSMTWYLEQNPDVASAQINPFVHWVLHGRAEGRLGCPPRIEPAVVVPAVDWTAYEAVDLDCIQLEFDATYYLKMYPEVAKLGVDPAVHYLIEGWKKGHNPHPDFSTSHYIRTYADIRRAGHNPFLHWCRNGRYELRETQSYIDRARRNFRPRVSVILPNYNHAPYLPERIRSIVDQTYDNLEIIILDDKSSDNSQEVIRATVAELGIEAQLVFNKVSSGNVFAQWEKGLSLATGDLIWICESDDFCEPDFLERLVPTFADQSVNIAFGRIQLSDAEGSFMEGLDGYREGAEEGIWSETLTRPAAQWFDNAFGVNNVIANVGGSLFRRMDLPQAVWDQARTYKICGDWYLYIQIAGAGQITFEPQAVAYFRQHDTNTSASNFHRRYYYDENMAILRELVRNWGIRAETRKKFLGKVAAQYRHFKLNEEWGDFDEVFDTAALMAAKREQAHVQLHFLGFHTGGGELFPINLANAYVQAGITVSMMAVDMLKVNPDMRARLNTRVPVYHVNAMAYNGRGHFLSNAGVSVINSHVASSDAFLANADSAPIEVPYVVTLHGSYVGLQEAPDHIVSWILNNVTSWVYTADRNLGFFENREVDWDSFVKLPNAMPRDPRPAPFTRHDLGIEKADIVFTLIARGIKRKGWRAAIVAFRRLRQDHGRADTHLLLVGDGESTDEARALAGDLEGVHFLGYQSEINGILRESDCLILPTRFEGESYPLCLIQAIQEHVPAIATDIGEICSMMSEGKQAAGLILENERDSRAYFEALTEAMVKMCDARARAKFAKIAAKRARIFDMEDLVKSYDEVYTTAQWAFRQD